MEQSTVEICDACSKGDLDLVKSLITRDWSPWVRDDQGNTLFHLCCSSSHCGLDVLQYLIGASEIVSCIYLHNNEGSTPLHLACGAGKKEFVEFLVQGQYNDIFGLFNYRGETPLYFASKNSHSNIVSLICTNPDYILDPDDIYQCIKVAPNWDIMTILLRAISFNDFMTRVHQEKHVYLAKQIFKASTTIQWKDSSSPFFHQVAISGDLDIVQYLVNEVGCDVNGLDSEAYTPLHRAIEYGHLPIVQYLLSQPQCNCETRSNNCGMYPLHHATELGYLEIIKALDRRGCDINVSDDKGYTPIHNACNNGHLAVVEYLSSKLQCNLEVLDNTGRQPLHYALCQEHKEIVMFLKEKVSVDGIHQCIKSAVEDKVPGSMIELLVRKIGIKEYLTRRLEDQPTFSSNDTVLRDIIADDYPLHKSIKLSCLDITKYLVNIGIFDINLQTSTHMFSHYTSYTPLHIACEKGHFEIVKILTNHPQCNIEAENDYIQRPLHKACLSENVEIVRHLVVEKGCDVTAKDDCSNTPLHIACEKGHFEIVKILTNHPQCNIKSENNHKQRPLHKACESGNVDIVQHLVVEKGCDVTAKDKWRHTPLHIACGKGHFEIVKILTNHPQCNIEAENSCKQRPLHIACLSGNVDIVRHLVVEKGCDVTAKDDWCDTPLHIACEKGHFEIVKILTNHPQCNIEAENNRKLRPLRKACQSGNVDIVRHLVLEKGCDVTAKDGFNGTPLHIACGKGHLEIVKILTDHTQCNIEAENNHKQRPLHEACLSGKVDIVQHLVVEKGCDVTAKDDCSNTPLHIACGKGHLEIVKILTDHTQCNIEAENNHKQRPLHEACLSENVEIVRHLVVEKGCDVTAKDNYSDTPLHDACGKGHLEIVKILTDHTQCNIKSENNHKQRPLHKACQSGNVDIVQHLVVEKGCDVTAKDDCSDTPLHIACEKGHFEIVKILTNHPQCNIEAENNRKLRPLRKACQSGNVDIVRHLVLEKGCDVTAKDDCSNTPLHIACGKGHFEIVKILTNHPQCNIEAENTIKERPLHEACRSGNVDIIQHLIDKGCVIDGVYMYNRKNKNEIFSFIKYQQALHSSGEAMLCVVKCILTGPPGAGKSTLKKRLLNESLTEPSLSTGVVDAAIQVNSFRKLQQHDAVVTTEWRTQDLDEEAVLIFENIITSHPPTTSSDSIKHVSSSAMSELNVIDIKNDYTDEFEKESSNSYSDIEVNIMERQNETKELNEESKEEKNEDNNKGFKGKEEKNGSTTSHCLDTSSEIIQFNNSASSSTVTSLRANNEIDIRCDYTFKLEEDCRTEEIVKEVEEREIEDIKEEFKEKNENTGKEHIKLGINSLSKFVKSIPVTKRKVYEERSQQTTKDSHAMLHIIDTGGQPEFHEMLPALITGPAINLLVFDLTIDLTSRYEITYRSSSGDSKPYKTSLTHEEVIFRSLASIACLRQNTIGWSFDEVPLKDESEPAAFLIATHRDCFPNETEAQAKVDSVNSHLKLKIQDSGELFSEDLVQYSTSDQVIFPLDTRNDEKKIEELRSLLHRVISNRFHELPVPASWCAFSLKLRKSKKPLHLLDTCYKMAQECGIKDREDFKSVLWFLHHRVGVIMHYPEVEGLGNIIITDLQLVFDRITHLITSCFTFKELGSASSEKEFRDNGRFSESHVKQLSSRKGDPLTPTRLVSLLKHLHIVAGPMKIKVGHKTENYYFMPCALKPAPVEEEQRDQSICPAPLTIYFECGYTPVGVFCCLVVYLLSQTSKSELEWKLLDKIVHHRNKITFKVGKYHDRITLISRATYFEVLVERKDGLAPKPSLDVLCKQIISTLHTGLETVTQSLHYTYKSRHLFGFPCCCHTLPCHPAIVDENGIAAECVLTDYVMCLQERRHLVWSTKISELTTTSVSSEVQCTQSQESSSVTEVNDSMNEVIITDTSERSQLNKRSCDQSSTPPSSKRSTNRDEVDNESSSRESSISSQRQERKRTDEEDNSDYDDNITTSITKRQPSKSHELESYDQSTRSRGKEPAGGRPYKRKRRPDSNTNSQIPTRSSVQSWDQLSDQQPSLKELSKYARTSVHRKLVKRFPTSDTIVVSQDTIVKDQSSSQTINTDIDVSEMRRIMKKVLTKNYADLFRLPKHSLSLLAAELFAVGLISSGVQRTATFDDIMEEFQAGMNFKRSPAGLQEYFVKFLTSLNKVGGSFAAASSVLQDDLTKAIRRELKVELDFNHPTSKCEERKQHKRQRTDEEDNSDYDDNITTNITKRQPPRSHDIELKSQSTRPHGKEPAGDRPYKRKGKPDNDIDPSTKRRC